MSTRCDRHRQRRKRARAASRERVGYAHCRRKWAALCGPVVCRQMTADEQARYGAAHNAPDPYERGDPP